MPPRANPSITLMINQAQQKMRELKELQFFGGDALNLKRYKTLITVPADSAPHCWRIVMTPDDPATSMPLVARQRPATENAFAGGQIEPVHRTDGNFEYLMIPNPNFSGSPRGFYFIIEYSGGATFTINQIG